MTAATRGAVGCTVAGAPFDPPGCAAAATGAALGRFGSFFVSAGYGIAVYIRKVIMRLYETDPKRGKAVALTRNCRPCSRRRGLPTSSGGEHGMGWLALYRSNLWASCFRCDALVSNTPLSCASENSTATFAGEAAAVMSMIAPHASFRDKPGTASTEGPAPTHSDRHGLTQTPRRLGIYPPR